MNVRFFMIGFLLLFSWGQNAYSDKHDGLFYRNFWYPKYQYQLLNYCTFDGKKCGLTVANDYCQLMGYQKASKAMIAYNVGLTNYLSTRFQCKGWSCNGFMLISCEGKFSHKPMELYHYRLQRFVFPHLDHYRVDWCYKNKQKCGPRAAHSFCRRMGYLRAKTFKIQDNVPATKALGDHQLCFGNQCHGFSEIVCFR